MRRAWVASWGMVLLTACSRGDFVPSPSALGIHAAPAPRSESKTGLVDPAALMDFGVALADTGVRDVAGHSFVLTPPERVSWSRRPSQWEGADGWRADGTLLLTDDEHTNLERLVDDLWKLAAVNRELAPTSDRSADRTWAIAMKRQGEVRVLEGHGWPAEVADAFAFVHGRIYAHRQPTDESRERDRLESLRRERTCDPPWLIDSEGHKRYKVRCLD